MTLILPRTSLAKDFITGGQNSVGLRVPAQNIALALLKKFEDSGGRGIAAPSANRFGAVSPTNAEAVNDELSKYLNSDDMVLDGGQCLVGIESTIIDCTGSLPAVLRPGAITEKMIEMVINKKINPTNKKNPIRTSGMLQSHYSPKAEVILDVEAKEGEGFIALSNIPTPAGAFRLAAPNNVEEYSQQLYSALRHGDSLNLSIIKVKPATGVGLAESIKDRLERAAYKKT
jgi:L-threonylcarbamoyladenylate synthase